MDINHARNVLHLNGVTDMSDEQKVGETLRAAGYSEEEAHVVMVSFRGEILPAVDGGGA